MTTGVLILCMALGSSPPVEVQPLSGGVLSGSIVELNAQGVVVETAQGRQTLELNRLAGLVLKNPQAASNAKPSVWVELVDGSAVLGTAYESAGGRAKITLVGGGSVETATQDITSVRFQTQSDALAGQWTKILESSGKSDLLVVRQDEVLDYHAGAVRGVNAAAVQFDIDGEVLPVDRGKVHGLVYRHPAGRELPEPLCSVADSSGSSWSARMIALAGDAIEWTTPAGVKVVRPAAEVARIDFSRGKIVYLSDLKPESADWTPYFGLGKELPVRTEFYLPRKDRSLSGGPLELDGSRFAKGLGIHSRTTLVYRLPARFSHFKAMVGIDDRVRPRGHVQLTVRGDDRVLADMTVAGTEPAKPLDLDLTGVRRLTILVDFGNDLDIADHLDLCDARLVK